MATSTLRSTVESRIQANWTATPVDYDNTVFTVPTTAWIKVVITDNSTRRAELGTGVKNRRALGVIFADVYAPVGKGSNAAKVIADSFATLFRDFKTANLTCDEPNVKTLGEKDGWYRLVVGVPYRYDFLV